MGLIRTKSFDFALEIIKIHKTLVDKKEYWLELLFRSDYIESKEYDLLISEIQSILRILASIIITTKKNMKN